MYLQLTINCIDDVTFTLTTLLAVSVKFLVSVHRAFSMIRWVLWTVSSNFNNREPSYHETMDRGLLDMFPVSIALSVSFTIVTAWILIDGPTLNKKIFCLRHQGICICKPFFFTSINFHVVLEGVDGIFNCLFCLNCNFYDFFSTTCINSAYYGFLF